MRLQGAMRDLRAQAQANTQKKNSSGMGQVLKFAFLPDFKSAFSGIVQAWYLLVNTVAQLFVLAKLIDADHPAARYQAEYRFKLMEVISLAAKRVKFDRTHALQALMFVAIIIFLLTIFFAGIISLLTLFVGKAHAQIANDPNYIANDLLSGLFNAGKSNDVIVTALRNLLSFYSTTALIFGGIIFAYIIISTVAETANSGVPFGKNFNHVWAPIRLIVAIGLLIPLSGGMNSGQHLILYVAKFSSDIATTGWTQFSKAMNLNTALNGVNVNQIVSSGMKDTIAKAFSMELCAARENAHYNNFGYNNGIYFISNTAEDAANENLNIIQQSNPNAKLTSTSISYLTTEDKNCGDVTFRHYAGSNPFSQIGDASKLTPDDYLMRSSARTFITLHEQLKPIVQAYREQVDNKTIIKLSDLPDEEYTKLTAVYTHLAKDVADYSTNLLKNQIDTEFDTKMAQSGWLSAPLWLYRVAQLNASLQTMLMGWQPTFSAGIDTGPAQLLVNAKSVKSAPIQTVSQAQNIVPNYMYQIGEQLSSDGSVFNNNGMTLADKTLRSTIGAGMRTAAGAQQIGRDVIQTSLVDMANKLGCTNAQDCMNYLKAIDTNNPITSIAKIGQIFFSFGIEFFLNAAATTAGQAIPMAGGIAASVTPIFYTLGMSFFGAGVLMGFLIPLGPALRFYAAVIGWVMTVFQMVLAIPIVALGHLSTKGDGYMGDMRGFYAAMLGLVLRPLLMILGLIVGFIAFTIGVKIINAVFIPAVEATFNVSNQGVILFHMMVFVFVYAFFLFALANSAFKMIDLVPDQAISWINARLEKQGTEDDFRQVGDAAKGGLTSVASGSRELSGHVGGAVRPLGQGLGQALNK